MFKRFVFATAALVAVAMLSGDAQAAGRGRCRGGYVAAAAPVTTAQAGGGYRTYSYEPGPVYRSPSRAGASARPSFLDARSKALGW